MLAVLHYHRLYTSNNNCINLYFSTDELKTQFEADYPNCNLTEFLSHFSQPLPLRDHQLFRGSDADDHVNSTEGGQFVQMVGWLLKRHLIVQVRIFKV